MVKKEVCVCNECGSDYFKSTSKMKNLCPKCASILYGYPKCNHIFKNKRCIFCFWNGNQSDYIQKLFSDNL